MSFLGLSRSSGIFPICPFPLFRLLTAPTRNSPERVRDTISLIFFSLLYIYNIQIILIKCKENHPKNKDFSSQTSPQKSGKEGRNAQENKDFLANPKKQVSTKKQGKEDQGWTFPEKSGTPRFSFSQRVKGLGARTCKRGISAVLARYHMKIIGKIPTPIKIKLALPPPLLRNPNTPP